jgi:hypothetical protein
MQEYERRLRRLVDQAWDLRDSPYYRDACQAIVDLHYHRLEIEAAEAEEKLARLDPFIRECLYLIV